MKIPTLCCFLLLAGARPGAAQDPAESDAPTGFKLAGLPALNYDSDEGLGYGARLSLFNHAEGGYNPYVYVIDAEVFLTTQGRKQAFVFFDAPYLGGPQQRITAEVQYQTFDPAPYYGLGNDAVYDEALTDAASEAFIHEDYYGFERTRITAWATYQRRLGPVRLLGGFGLAHTAVGVLDGPTRLQTDDDATGKAGGFTNAVKAGVIYDTRDFEPAPSRGDWTDLILEAAAPLWGSDYAYTRLTFTHRHYVSLARNVVFAQRVVFEKSWGDMPFYEMAFFGSSFRIEEGLGGANSVRGLLRNRFLGPVKAFGNLELRWRVRDVRVLKQRLYLALSGFLDYGRVWRNDEALSLRAFHTGRGGGVHVGWNETFIVTADVATSREVDVAIYLGIGYLF